MDRWQLIARGNNPEPLTAEQANAIRQAAIRAASEAAAQPSTRRAPMLIIGGMLGTAVAGGLLVTRAQPPLVNTPSVDRPTIVRQVQFATPGGTKIIWQFDPNFTLRETLP